MTASFQHSDIFLVSGGDCSIALEPPQSKLLQILHKSLDKSDLVLVVEHCCNCKQHNSSLRHNQQKYVQVANDLLRQLGQHVHSRFMNIRLGVMRFPIINPTRIGAFEVYVAYRTQHGDLDFRELHSKIQSKFWPSYNILEKRLNSFMRGVLIPLYGMPSEYPVAWDDTGLSSDQWDYAAEAISSHEIVWVFDCRELHVSITVSHYLNLQQ